MTKQKIETSNAPAPGGAYSQAIRVGDFVYTAGMGPWHPVSRQVIGETIEEQTMQTLENIRAILNEAGMGMDAVVKTTVHLSDLGLFARLMKSTVKISPTPSQLVPRSAVNFSGSWSKSMWWLMTENNDRRKELLRRLYFDTGQVNAINEAIFRPELRAMSDFLDVIEKYGSPQEINRQASQASQYFALETQVRLARPEYLPELQWLHRQEQTGTFISISDYRRKVLGSSHGKLAFREDNPVTLEISACQYFPWLMEIARRAVEVGGIMPGRFIRVRNMKEQEADGDLPAMAAAMQIIGASYVEQLDTRGSDGSNIHLGGPETIIGYYGGVGQPNNHALSWLDEFLYYYTRYGVRQVLNVNNGTVLLAYMLHRLGIDIEFKISVTLGNDNPYSGLWTLLAAALFTRPDGTTPLAGLNWSNSVNAETIETAAELRHALGLEQQVRFEHHVTETWKGLVIQPYNRRAEVLALAETVPNISAKHEGGEPEVEESRPRPSEIQDYYRSRDEIISSGDWDALRLNFVDKFDSLNLTARALTEHGLSFVAAKNLHRQ